MNDGFLNKKLDERKQQHAFRTLQLTNNKIDFCSNDYLGIVKNKLLNSGSNSSAEHVYGSTGSRLLTGNYPLIEETEKVIASFHNAEAALIFNSGYDANIGLLSSVPQRGDVIFYDQLSHASIRDGIRLSFAESFSFQHNDMENLEKKLQRCKIDKGSNIFVVTESVFSMDGDICPAQAMTELCSRYNAHLIIDEAHATGIIGKTGEGLMQEENLEKKCFARIHTFGKACGAHGAAILGSQTLRNYLINFARSFIYSTALPAQAVQHIYNGYQLFPKLQNERQHLSQLINQFQKARLSKEKMKSFTPIQGVIIAGNEQVKKTAGYLQKNNIDVRPILYPTVPKGRERLRIVLHAFNTVNELEMLLNYLDDKIPA